MATTDGTITSFTSTPQTAFQVDGVPWTVHTAGDSYSLTEPDNHTLRFELRAGDRAWYDGSNVDRAEVQRAPMVAPGTPINISYQFMLEPGATNTASWVVTGEMHNDDVAAGVPTSPPFAIDLSGEHLTIVARYVQPGVNASNAAGNVKTLTLWTDPNPIQRGQYYNIDVRANFSNNSSGYLDVFIDGKQVVDYNGPLGYGYSTYWMEGLYRSANSGTLAADFRDFTMTTGSYAPVTLTQPTTAPPASSTTPTTPNTAPAVTQVSTSPDTGGGYVGALAVAGNSLGATSSGWTVDPGTAVTTTGSNYSELSAMGMTAALSSGWSSPTIDPSAAGPANQGWGGGINGLVTSATQMPAGSSQDTVWASQANRGFALLNQGIAASSGRVDGGPIMAAMTNDATWTQSLFLTKPQQ